MDSKMNTPDIFEENPSLEYFAIGNELITLENKGSRYAYAAGKLREYCMILLLKLSH